METITIESQISPVFIIYLYIVADHGYNFKQSYCTVAGVSNVHNLVLEYIYIFIILNLLIIEWVEVTSTYPTVDGHQHRHLYLLYSSLSKPRRLSYICLPYLLVNGALVGTSAVVPVSSLFNAVVSPF